MIVDKSAVRPTDVVLEIGPGTGKWLPHIKETLRSYCSREQRRSFV